MKNFYAKKISYYDREGKEISVEEWGRLFEDKSYQILKQDSIRSFFISTIWLGLDHGWTCDELHIFETMVFIKPNNIPCYCHRSGNEQDALSIHEKAVDYAKQLKDSLPEETHLDSLLEGFDPLG